MEFKMCKSCNRNLKINKFGKSKNVKDGYENKCKECRQKQRPTYSKNCEVCKSEFITKTKETRFCSKECQGIARQNRVKVNCSYCNKEKEIIKSKFDRQENYYCNQNCRIEHLKVLMLGKNNPNYNRVLYECDGCGDEILVIPSRMKEQRYIFCSNECYKENIGKFFQGEDNPNYNRGKFVCEQCGEKFERIRSANRGNHVFCSRECYEEHHRKKGRSKEVELNCPICNKSVKVWESKLKYTKDVYCSKECARKGYGIKYSGENSPSYNPNMTNEDRIIQRKTNEYYLWRKSVYEKDNYTCQCCGDDKGGNLNAHHLVNYMENEELRTDIDNGITLCKTCHKTFHDTYGYRNNTKEQINEYLEKCKSNLEEIMKKSVEKNMVALKELAKL